MANRSPTRGSGLLEPWLARARAKRANALIPEELRTGTLVDIGCGVPPLFLERTRFGQKIGVDRRNEPGTDPATGVQLLRWDANGTEPMPLRNECADAVTMLAVIEHVDEHRVDHVVSEARRILHAGGIFIITTPRPAIAPILRCVARMGLVSREEINEHKRLFNPTSLVTRLEKHGFRRERMCHGTFEFHMNSWLTARK